MCFLGFLLVLPLFGIIPLFKPTFSLLSILPVQIIVAIKLSTVSFWEYFMLVHLRKPQLWYNF